MAILNAACAPRLATSARPVSDRPAPLSLVVFWLLAELRVAVPAESGQPEGQAADGLWAEISATPTQGIRRVSGAVREPRVLEADAA
jgi:hypothetical protein